MLRSSWTAAVSPQDLSRPVYQAQCGIRRAEASIHGWSPSSMACRPYHLYECSGTCPPAKCARCSKRSWYLWLCIPSGALSPNPRCGSYYRPRDPPGTSTFKLFSITASMASKGCLDLERYKVASLSPSNAFSIQIISFIFSTSSSHLLILPPPSSLLPLPSSPPSSFHSPPPRNHLLNSLINFKSQVSPFRISAHLQSVCVSFVISFFGFNFLSSQ